MSIQIIWSEYKNLIIRDVHKKWHARICTFMQEHYFKTHRLYEILEMSDEQDQYMQYLKHILNDECSIVVMDERTNEIYAVALLKWMSKEWKSWVALALILRTGKLACLMQLCRKMIYNYAAENPHEPFDSLHLFEYYISDELKSSAEFMETFFTSICKVAQHMKMPRITFMALSVEEQQQADNAGLTEIARIFYSMYVVQKTRPLDRLRDINEMYAALYEQRVQPLVPYYELFLHKDDLNR